MKIIAIIGKKESGKSTFANYLSDLLRVYQPTDIVLRHSFGNALKDILIESGLCQAGELFEKKTPYSRNMLQKVGTEIVRKIDPDYWCKKMWEKLREDFHYEPNCIVIIDDIRFLNESSMLYSLGASFVKIYRNSASEEIDNHISETQQEKIEYDYSYHNDKTLADLLQFASTVYPYLLNKANTERYHFKKERTKLWRLSVPRSKFSL